MDDAVIAIEAQRAVAYQTWHRCQCRIGAHIDTVLGDIGIVEADASRLNAQVIECFVVHRAIAIGVLCFFNCAEYFGKYRDIVDRHPDCGERRGCSCFAECTSTWGSECDTRIVPMTSEGKLCAHTLVKAERQRFSRCVCPTAGHDQAMPGRIVDRE